MVATPIRANSTRVVASNPFEDSAAPRHNMHQGIHQGQQQHQYQQSQQQQQQQQQQQLQQKLQQQQQQKLQQQQQQKLQQQQQQKLQQQQQQKLQQQQQQKLQQQQQQKLQQQQQKLEQQQKQQQEQMRAAPEPPKFVVGDVVHVESRTWPGINKPGGVGKITRCNVDGSFAISYVLGGSEKRVHPQYIHNSANYLFQSQRPIKERDFFINYQQQPRSHRDEDGASSVASGDSTSLRSVLSRKSSASPRRVKTISAMPATPPPASSSPSHQVQQQNATHKDQHHQASEQEFKKAKVKQESNSASQVGSRSSSPTGSVTPKKHRKKVSRPQTPPLRSSGSNELPLVTTPRASTPPRPRSSTPPPIRKEALVLATPPCTRPASSLPTSESSNKPPRAAITHSSPRLVHPRADEATNANTPEPKRADQKSTAIPNRNPPKRKIVTSPIRTAQGDTGSFGSSSVSNSEDRPLKQARTSESGKTETTAEKPTQLVTESAHAQPEIVRPTATVAASETKAPMTPVARTTSSSTTLEKKALTTPVARTTSSSTTVEKKAPTTPVARTTSSSTTVEKKAPTTPVARTTSSSTTVEKKAPVTPERNPVRVEKTQDVKAKPSAVATVSSTSGSALPKVSTRPTLIKIKTSSPSHRQSQQARSKSPSPTNSEWSPKSQASVRYNSSPTNSESSQKSQVSIRQIRKARHEPLQAVEKVVAQVVEDKHYEPLTRETSVLSVDRHSTSSRRARVGTTRSVHASLHAQLELQRAERLDLARKFEIEHSQTHKVLIDALSQQWSRNANTSRTRLEELCLRVNRFWRPTAPASNLDPRTRKYLYQHTSGNFMRLRNKMLERQAMEASILCSKQKRELAALGCGVSREQIEEHDLCPLVNVPYKYTSD